jgi:mannose-6-phosphate isomerase
MSVDATNVRLVEKPWGVANTHPWGPDAEGGAKIGELWFDRIRPLSIQVHPDDLYARSIGLPHGKTEAWLILSAAAGAQVAVGLRATVSRSELRSAIEDGTVAAQIAWQNVVAGDVICVPAGTIHAIGAGLVLVEIQQNSNTTFRILDLAHGRPLDIAHGVAAARLGPAAFQARPDRISLERTRLVSTQAFVFERIKLPPNTTWQMQADLETWVLCLSGAADAGGQALSTGIAVCAEAEIFEIRVGSVGTTCVVAYPGQRGPNADLLTPRGRADHLDA